MFKMVAGLGHGNHGMERDWGSPSLLSLHSGHARNGFLLHTSSPPAQKLQGQPPMSETYKALCFPEVIALARTLVQ